MKHFLAAMVLAAGLFASVSWAAESSKPVGVVELFTSQGCNSCPPADALLDELAGRGDIIALGYHVDYWDYLGWRDTLGSAEFTQRQYGYADSFGSRSVYTPQAVINGRTHVNGASRSQVNSTLAKMSKGSSGLSVPLSATKHGETVTIKAHGAELAGDAHLVLVSFAEAAPVKIERGENRGRTIVYTNAVTRLRTVGMWHGGNQEFEIPISEIMKGASGGCAILLQEVSRKGAPGAILGATVISAR